MRISALIALLLCSTISVFAEERYLPESADPATYTLVSDCYAHDDITFYTVWGSILGDYADWKNLKILSDGCFAKRGSKYLYSGAGIYYWDRESGGIVDVNPDPRTFHIVKFQSGVTLWVDKTHIYRGGIAFMTPAGFDIWRIRVIGTDYITDEKTLYYFGSADGSLLEIRGIDIPSFQSWTSSGGTRFLIDKNWFSLGNPYQPIPLSETHRVSTIDVKDMRRFDTVDTGSLTESGMYVYDRFRLYLPYDFPPVERASFQILADNFSRDQYHIYSPTGKILSMIDANDYEYIGNSIFRSRGKLWQWCQYEVGCDGYEVTAYDTSTFHQTPWGFADKNGNYDIYLRPISSNILNPNIVPIGDTGYFRDQKSVYLRDWGGTQYILLTGALAPSFRTFSGTSYARDVRSCWLEDKRFDCQARTFSAIDAWFARDARGVYFQGKKIIGADPETFQRFTNTGGYNWIETYHYSRDKDHMYYDERMIRDADPESFSLMKDLHSRDKNHIYYAWWKIEWADPATYTPLRYSFARDKNHFYFAGLVLDKIQDPKWVKIISRDKLSYNGRTDLFSYWKTR